MAEATSLGNAVMKIKNNICKHGVYSSFIRFTVLGSKYGDVSFTTDNSATGSSICCITNFENTKNGSGQANSFSITIAFSPSKNGLFYHDASTLDFSNVNLIDEILNVNTKPGTQTKCRIQYGYGYPMSLLTPVYEGTIIDYSTEISNGILNYTITGYSGLSIEFKDSKISIEGSAEGEDAKMKKPTDMIQELYDEYIKDKTNYVLEWGEDTQGTDKEIEIETVQDVSIISYMKTLLDNAEYSEDNDDTAMEHRSQYIMTISDVINTDGNKTIRIERYDPAVKKDKQDSSETIRFSWMGPSDRDSGNDYASNAMVIDFKADFKGSVTMAYDYSSMVEKAKRVGIDSAGNSVETSGTTRPTTGANTKNDNILNLNLWVSRLQYVYGATLVLIGIPYEIRILDNVYIAPMIFSQEHHTGGLYKIMKITDVIDGSGFTTTLELSKNMGDNTALRNAKKKRAEVIEEIKNATKYTICSNADGQALTELYREKEYLDEILKEKEGD